MKKIPLFLLLLLTVASTAVAQQEKTLSSKDSSSTSGEHEVGWIHSHMLDNWFIDIKHGGQLYYGFEDRTGPLSDRLTGKSELRIGHWLFPTIGLRGGLGIGTAHGFISLDSYMNNRSALTSDFGTCWGRSASDTTIGGHHITGALGGYYWPYDEERLIQEWEYMYGGFDVLFNIDNLRGMNYVKLDRRWKNILYLGFHIRFGISEYHPERIDNTNAANEGHIGYLGMWNLTGGLNLSADVRLSLMEGNFDRERIDGVETMSPDLELSVLAGITYDFNLRSNKMRRKYYVELGRIDYATDKVPPFVALKQTEEVIHVTRADTILVYQKYEADSPEIAIFLDSLREAVNKVSIDTNTPLDTILLKHLLPYEMVFFDLDKWDIRPTEEFKIERMARVMKAYPKAIFHLYGSADAKTGTVKRNTFLSHNRADMVYNRLILEYGIPASQMRRDYLGGILDYDPFILNRTTVIIMEHPAVQRAFEAMKSQRKAGGDVVEVGK